MSIFALTFSAILDTKIACRLAYNLNKIVYLRGEKGCSSSLTTLGGIFRLFTLLESIKESRLLFASGWNWEITVFSALFNK